MFSFFKKKKKEFKINNPYRLANNTMTYYTNNFIDLNIKLGELLNNIDKIYYMDFTPRTIKRHRYYTNFDNTFINNVEDVIKNTFEKMLKLEEVCKIDKKNTDNIDAKNRILTSISLIRKSLNDVIEILD